MKIIEASGAQIPAIGLGTWLLEGQTCRRVVREAIEIGYRHIDTARMYGNERDVGEGIRESGIGRDDLFVTTKIWWTDLAGADFERSVEAALATLKLSQVDLLLIHWPNATIPLKESIEALNAARSKGLTRHIGVANFPSVLFDEAASISQAPLVCNQVEHHPMLSQAKVHAACRRHDAAMIGYSPIARGGELLGRAAIQGIADRYGKTPAQAVLRWAVEKDGVGAIPKTAHRARLVENLDIFDFELAPEETDTLDAVSGERQRLVDPAFAPQWDVA